MRTVKFLPKAVTGFDVEGEGGQKISIPPRYSGHIILKAPTFFERQELKGLLLEVVAKDGEADLEAIRSKKEVNVSAVVKGMAAIVKASVPFYQEVALKNLSTGEELKSFDDLSYDPDAESILQEVAQELASGLSISKNS